MKQAIYTADQNSPDNQQPVGESDPDSTPVEFGFLRWLKYFTLYLGAVMAAGALGFYFLWQIITFHDLPQFLKSVGDSNSSSRPPATAVAPPILSSKFRGSTSQPPSPTSGTATTVSPPASPPVTDGNPVATPLSTEPPSATAATQPESATPPAEDTAATPDEDTAATPQTEIEQLLANAQQQMDSRRLTAPTSGNALRTYQRILELQPDHPTAIDGIQRIAAYYVGVAEQSLRQGRLDESLAYANRGLRAVPKHPALLNLRKAAQQAKRREQERQQALIEETQRQQPIEQPEQEQFQPRQPVQRPQQQQQQPWWRQPSPQYSPQYNDSGFNQR